MGYLSAHPLGGAESDPISRTLERTISGQCFDRYQSASDRTGEHRSTMLQGRASPDLLPGLRGRCESRYPPGPRRNLLPRSTPRRLPPVHPLPESTGQQVKKCRLRRLSMLVRRRSFPTDLRGRQFRNRARRRRGKAGAGRGQRRASYSERLRIDVAEYIPAPIILRCARPEHPRTGPSASLVRGIPCPLQIDDPASHAYGNGMRPVIGFEFGEDAPHVALDGFFSER